MCGDGVPVMSLLAACDAGEEGRRGGSSFCADAGAGRGKRVFRHTNDEKGAQPPLCETGVDIDSDLTTYLFFHLRPIFRLGNLVSQRYEGRPRAPDPSSGGELDGSPFSRVCLINTAPLGYVAGLAEFSEWPWSEEHVKEGLRLWALTLCWTSYLNLYPGFWYFNRSTFLRIRRINICKAMKPSVARSKHPANTASYSAAPMGTVTEHTRQGRCSRESARDSR